MIAIIPLGVVGPWQIVIIAVVVLVLFGANKIPEFMKGLGKGVKSFKQGMNEVQKELEDEEESEDKK
ncbi:MAG: twin-arginine translocase TatA/TatE family subunit [Bacteroidales bacterium]|nr:twin-arginine translocase TatA/TatE family subunit [Bacteroidales bacterium]